MNGVYHANFTSTLGSGAGTVYLENGALRGGDATVAYWGSYSIVGDKCEASVVIAKHGEGFSILGDARALNFRGSAKNGVIEGVGKVPGTNIQASISLRKVAAL